jgi:lysophospholipid acyltransferase (LPLAT)-like uncharacterized protein
MGSFRGYIKETGLRAALKLIEAWLGSCRASLHWHPEALAMERKGHPIIGAMWHSQLIYLLYALRRYPAAIMVSGSADGEWVARALAIWGQHPVRGSKFKGGSAAIREIARLVNKEGVNAGIIADGSRGPACRAQIGAIVLARTTGRPIVPIAAAARPAYYFSSWDRLFLPLPFSRVSVVFGQPFLVPKDAKGRMIEPYRNRLQQELNDLTREANRIVGVKDPVNLPENPIEN